MFIGLFCLSFKQATPKTWLDAQRIKKRKGCVWYWIEKQIEPSHNHPSQALLHTFTPLWLYFTHSPLSGSTLYNELLDYSLIVHDSAAFCLWDVSCVSWTRQWWTVFHQPPWAMRTFLNNKQWVTCRIKKNKKPTNFYA